MGLNILDTVYNVILVLMRIDISQNGNISRCTQSYTDQMVTLVM